ncbi:unnamed protein product [Ectocarpus sp. CCAP 1310/34]|nr:unnamed protein product [Ectocarpus sp. CCAP 1310/34]
MASRRQTRQHSLRKQFVREPSVLAHHSAVLIYGISPREILHMNQDGLTEQNLKELNDLGGADKLAKMLRSDVTQGLPNGDNLEERATEFGHNWMPVPDPKTWVQLFIDSFDDTTLIILIVSAIVSLAVGFYSDPKSGWIEGVAILCAVLVVAVVTATNDYSKDKQFRALNAVKDDVKVVRAGEIREMSTRQLLVGDVVLLEAGDKIPADGVLTLGDDVTVNESSLTGEAEDVRKGVKIGEGEDAFLLSGCTLTSGRASMMVVAVGAESRWGRIKAKLQDEPSDTPLQEKLDAMAATIGYVGMACAAATFVATMCVYFTTHRVVESAQLGERVDTLFENVLHSFVLSVTIVVVAVPEGLPLAVTISLAYSTSKMLRDNNLIRVLAACETMGNATTICSDKTGTLTENRMTVVEGWFAGEHSANGFPNVAGVAADSICEGISVNTTARLTKDGEGATAVVGNKTEGALLALVGKLEQNYWELRVQRMNPGRGDRLFPFSSHRKRMTALIHGGVGGDPDGQRVYSKGAAEIVLASCTHQTTASGEVVPITPRDRKALVELIETYGDSALRAVGLAHRDMPTTEISARTENLTPEDLEHDLVLDAIVGIKDPLREDVKYAVKQCQVAGIMVRMVTGDNIATAKAIATECGIFDPGYGVALEGPAFRKMTPAQLDDILPRLQVLARSSPDDKHLLVTRLNGTALPRDRSEWEELHPELDWNVDRDRTLPGYWDEWVASRADGGEVVGATGDGTNDAPALKTADVGLSMGLSGTDVAKDASDIVIMDDRFSSIVKAVLWGRSVFDNIRKFLQFQLTVNVVALTLTFLSAVSGYEPPLNAVMMLWVNLIMDTMGALALGTEPPTLALLRRRPYKRNSSLINRIMWRHIAVQAVYQLVLLTWLLLAGAEFFGVPDGSPKHFTIVFNAFVFCQIFNEFNARSITNGWNIVKGLKNPMFLGVIVFTVLAQFLIVQEGGSFTRTEDLNSEEWATTILMGAAVLPLGVVMRFLPPSIEGERNFAGYKPRHGTNGKTNGAPKDSAGTFLAGALVSVVLPLAGIAYFIVLNLQQFAEAVSSAAAAAAAAAGSVEADL